MTKVSLRCAVRVSLAVDSEDDSRLAAGLHNLLINCAAVRQGETLLLVCEDPHLGWYDAQVPEAVAGAARELGITPTVLPVGGPTNDAQPALEAAVAAHDCTIYFSRIGDQDRFGEALPGKRSVMCYVRDLDLLASAYCRVPYDATRAFKAAVDAEFARARQVTVTCPHGTRLTGQPPPGRHQGDTDVSVYRFPLGVPTPMLADVFSGQVALRHFLTPTGSKVYEPACLPLTGTTLVHIRNGRITAFDGPADIVAQIQAHYEQVARKFGIDQTKVHSWHAGIHPACAYAGSAADDPNRWSNTVFCNPRLVHFHTCGEYPPGEISWNVIDPTIELDGQPLWQDGVMQPGGFEQTNKCIERWPALAAAFAKPSRRIGLANVSL